MEFSFKTIIASLQMAFLILSCRNSNTDEINAPNHPNTEMEGLIKITKITNNTHVIDFYSKSDLPSWDSMS